MLLGPDDPLPIVSRVLVAGASGSGKSTVARAVSARLGLPYTELDGLYHGPGWVPRESFVEDVRALAASERWVTEWQYDVARPILLERADLMVWLDLPRHLIMARVIRRTLRRRLRREVLWNGNVEPPLWTILREEEHIVRWAWTTWPRAAERVAIAGEARPDLPVVRLSTRREVARWLSSLERSQPSCGESPRPPSG